MRPPSGWLAWARQPLAPRAWDALLAGSGLVALAGIGLSLYGPTEPVRDLAVFFALALFINGPYSGITPVGFEPILMTFGQLYPPLLVAVIGVVGQLAIEFVNYRLYGAVLEHRLARRARASRWTQRVVAWFAVAPFMTVAAAALLPLPFWTVRIAAPLARYPVHRFLAATAIGRLPRLWFYAALGAAIPFAPGVILGVGLGLSVLLGVMVLLRRRRGRAVA